MDKVESDLNRSKQLREKQAREFEKQLQEQKLRHEHEVKKDAVKSRKLNVCS